MKTEMFRIKKIWYVEILWNYVLKNIFIKRFSKAKYLKNTKDTPAIFLKVAKM